TGSPIDQTRGSRPSERSHNPRREPVQERVVREIRMLRAMRRGLGTGLRGVLHGDERGKPGHNQRGAQGFTPPIQAPPGLPIEVPGCRVHGDDEFRFYGKSALEKTVVRFVPDDTELRKRIANGEALDNFSNEFWMIAGDVRVIFQDRWADPRIDQTGACEL